MFTTTMDNKVLFLYLGLFLAIFGCSSDVEEVEPNNRFTKIYNNENFDDSFYALDVKQTADGGYLILGRKELEDSPYGGAYVIKTDDEGNYQWEAIPTLDFRNPVPNLVFIDGAYHFVCMTGVDGVLAKVNEDGKTIDLARPYADVTLPLHASATSDGGLLILGYDQGAEESSLSKIGSDKSFTWQTRYAILEDQNEAIFDHMFYVNKRLPFFTGSLEEGGYFMNGFSDFTLSVEFVDAGGGKQGAVQGFRDEGTVSSLVHLSGNQFSLSKYSYTQNFVLPLTEFDPTTVNNIKDLEGNEFPEIAPEPDVRVLRQTINGNSYLIYAANSKSNQIVLYAYDEAKLIENGGEFAYVGTTRVGFSDRFEIANIIPTEDEGLAIAATTYLGGRFSRLALFKLSPGDLRKLAGL
ncbi:hypothetical protein [Flexithrix dorotheae]|uniref:hypothetical protein n=1 Tax=Flexithrix dorotheae TaxID=70993 RepID=UPI0003AA18F2|nr:hypothetical protein [Flexithrix dorotheae]